MKKLSLLLSILLSLSVKSQITLNHTLSNGFAKFTTTSLGDKYLTGTDTVTIYNSNWSVYRQVILPAGYQYSDFQPIQTTKEIPSISDKLYNSDTLLELLGIKLSGGGPGYSCSVINELGQIIYTFPDTNLLYAPSIYTIDGNFMIWYQTYSTSNNVKVYSLPGSLPCQQCSGIDGIIEPNQGGGISGFNVYPNPFNSSLSLQYDLLSLQTGSRIVITDIQGQELKSISLTKQSDNLIINTLDLPKGTLIVTLYGSGQNPVSKRVIKI